MKKVVLVGLVVLGTVLGTKVVQATDVSGNVSGTWTLGDSPYIVTANATVQNGATLVIDPKVEVRFAQNAGLIVFGTLTAIGNLSSTITFTASSTTPSAGFWQSIKFSGSNAKGTLSYCEIGYAKQAVYLENVLGIVITHNYIHDNKGDDGSPGTSQNGEMGCGIYLLQSHNGTISSNIIKNNIGGHGGSGMSWCGGGAGGIGCGIYFSSSMNNTISGNTISQNTGGQGGNSIPNNGSCSGPGGIGCGIYLSSSTGNISLGNTISQNTGGQGGTGNTNGVSGQGYGIYIDSISFNNIIDSSNTYNGEPIFYYCNQTGVTIENQNLTLAGSGSTNLGRVVLINCQNFSIKNNTIAGGIGETGEMGCGIYLSSSTNTTISGNTISHNIGGNGGAGGVYGGPTGNGGIGTGIYLVSSNNNEIKYCNTGSTGFLCGYISNFPQWNKIAIL